MLQWRQGTWKSREAGPWRDLNATGAGKPRHGHHDANGASRQQHEEPCPDLPVGTKLQGFVDHVRENFGFIRSVAAHLPVSLICKMGTTFCGHMYHCIVS